MNGCLWGAVPEKLYGTDRRIIIPSQLMVNSNALTCRVRISPSLAATSARFKNPISGVKQEFGILLLSSDLRFGRDRVWYGFSRRLVRKIGGDNSISEMSERRGRHRCNWYLMAKNGRSLANILQKISLLTANVLAYFWSKSGKTFSNLPNLWLGKDSGQESGWHSSLAHRCDELISSLNRMEWLCRCVCIKWSLFHNNMHRRGNNTGSVDTAKRCH